MPILKLTVNYKKTKNAFNAERYRINKVIKDFLSNILFFISCIKF
jgi:hypothetical protein